MVLVNGVKVRALVDTGCTQTIVSKSLVSEVTACSGGVMTVNGVEVKCGISTAVLTVCGRELRVQCLVLDSLLTYFDLVLGMDVVERLGGVNVACGKVVFGVSASSVLMDNAADGSSGLQMEDVDFSARFDGQKWIVRWNWIGEEPVLHNQVACYKVSADVQDEFDQEVQAWIKEGILLPVPEGEVVKSLVPLMAVSQVNKGKVRPVLDFRQLNKFVSSHPGASDVCDETMRKWRRVGENIALLDLRKAYLQLHVDSSLWKHQVVKYQGKMYYLTRLGFGLNCAPKIMSCVLAKVLSLDNKICGATDNYVDDILVNTDVVSTGIVADHLTAYGLRTKPPESINGAKVLGLHVQEDAADELRWSRGNVIPDVGELVTRRELFSVCGLLVGHYPVAGWIRVACGYIKRHSNGIRWEDDIGEKSRQLLCDLVKRVTEQDPVGGRWPVTSRDGRVWCDASSLALGCALEIDGVIVEDGAWLRKKDDGAHINMAELDAVLKGLNMAAKWNMQNIELLTDSATVFGWLNSVFFDSHKVKTKGMSEMLIKRRLAVAKELCTEYGLQVTVQWVKSAQNKADVLTRVPRRWLEIDRSEDGKDDVCFVSVVRRVHDQHHLGIDRTLFLARLENPDISRQEVADVVGACHQCKSIDPAPVTWEKGVLSTDKTWWRLAIDVTHYNGVLYLTIVDCGPSRFAVWRLIRNENADSISAEIEQLFREHGPPAELLMDNGAAFRSQRFRTLLTKWQVRIVYRCAYRPSGNGVVERNHRTIKRMAARTNSNPLDMVYWYNVTPKDGTAADSVPSRQVNKYNWRVPRINGGGLEDGQGADGEVDGKFAVGDAVFVKPRDVRCTTKWSLGTVSRAPLHSNVEINGIPRHVADIRAIPKVNEGQVEEEPEAPQADQVEEEPMVPLPGRPLRERKPPDRYGNNIFDT